MIEIIPLLYIQKVAPLQKCVMMVWLPSSCFMEFANCSSVCALKKLLMVVHDTPLRPSFPAFSSISSCYPVPLDKSSFERLAEKYLHIAAAALLEFFFMRRSSTTMDCFCGSTTRPFIWKPFIKFAVLKYCIVTHT